MTAADVTDVVVSICVAVLTGSVVVITVLLGWAWVDHLVQRRGVRIAARQRRDTESGGAS